MPALATYRAPTDSPCPTRPTRPMVVAHDAADFPRGLTAILPDLRARAARLCADRATADDLVQDTLERALRFAGQYQLGTNLRAWASQVLFSVFVTRYRRSRRERNAMRVLASDPCAWTAAEPFVAPDAASALTPSTRARLDSLPHGFRAVIELVDLGEQSYREAAEHLGVPVGTVMSRLHRGRRMLAEGLTKQAA